MQKKKKKKYSPLDDPELEEMRWRSVFGENYADRVKGEQDRSEKGSKRAQKGVKSSPKVGQKGAKSRSKVVQKRVKKSLKRVYLCNAFWEECERLKVPPKGLQWWTVVELRNKKTGGK